MNQGLPGKIWNSLKQPFTNLPLRLKLYLGLSASLISVLAIGGIAIYASENMRQLTSQTLTRQRRLADLASNINNNLLTIQNQAFEFYDTWTLTGFERDVGLGGFGYARETYLVPLEEQLDQVRADIVEIERLETDPETLENLGKISTNITEYESTLLEMSNHMEQLGYRNSGEIGQIHTIVTDLQDQLDQPGLASLQMALLQISQYRQDFFLRSDLASARLTRESIDQLKELIAAADDSLLSQAEKADLTSQLESYYDHFLAAASLHLRLQEKRAQLVGRSDLTSVLVDQLFEQQQTKFNTTLERHNQQLSDTTLTIVGLAGIIIAISAINAYIFATQIIQPIQALGETASQLGAGELDVRADVRSRDEIGMTAIALNQMADRLQTLLAGLEQQVSERTRELEASAAELVARTTELEKTTQHQAETNRQLQETVRLSRRRAALLQASTQVSNAIAQIRDLDRLLPQVTQLISESFGFYHAGIFLIDEAKRYAVLRAANSEGGQQMLARQHKLGVGSEGIVGYVTSTGQPRIALDVGEDAFYFDNPDMPNTRSEMAVPMKIGDQIIGALDVQSMEEAAFDKEDIRVLTALADQVAIAIENARLFRQTQAALLEAQHAQQRFLQQEWSRFAQEQHTRVHEYTLSGVTAASDASLPEVEQAWRDGELVIADGSDGTPAHAALAAPIKFQDEIIGVLDLQDTETERVWTEDQIALVQAVADQLGQALNSARLFEETQSRARRETLSRQITERIRTAGATGDLEAILQTTAEELGRALGITRAVARLSLPTDATSDKKSGTVRAEQTDPDLRK